MRLLHTSDWHLGQNFYSKSRAAEHDAFLTWLLDRAQEHEVDAIIVAGDIFDTGSPPSYAANCITVSSSSCSRPAVAWWCWRATTTRWRCSMNPAISSPFYTPPWWRTPATRRLSCRCATARRRHLLSGAVFTPARAGDQPGRSLRSGKTAAAAARHQRLLSGAVSAGLRAARRSPLPIIASGHLTTVGASKSDAVRDIYIGTLDAFPAQHFPLPTTLRWAIFTGRRWSAAASISATAARRCR